MVIGNQIPGQNILTLNNIKVSARDVNLVASDIGDFTGLITDFFDNLETVSYDTTSTNPKILKFIFKDTYQTSALGFGCNDPAASFSNIVFKTLGSAEQVLFTYDGSLDNTKRNSAAIYPSNKPFTGIQVEFHTTDPIGLSNFIIFKASDVNAKLFAVSALNDATEEVKSYRNTLNTNPAWVHRNMINETFHQNTATTTTLAAPVSAGDVSFTVASATGFSIGDEVKIEEGATQEGGTITLKNVVGTTLTPDRPFSFSYTAAADVIKVLTNMAIAGGTLAAPHIFEVTPPVDAVWQMTRILISMVHAGAGDNSKFGDIAALANGVVLRMPISATQTKILSNWKTNGDMRLDMYDVVYTDKAGGGKYSTDGRWTFTKSQTVIELNNSLVTPQKIEILIQDALNALTSFRIRIQGRVFSP